MNKPLPIVKRRVNLVSGNRAGVPSTRRRDPKTGRYFRVFHIGKLDRRPGRRPHRRQSRPAPARSRGSRRGRRESRAGPDDDPHELAGRAAELAEELQAATDGLLEQWRRERVAQGKHEQLGLEVGS